MHRTANRLRHIALASVMLFVSACGGGGNGDAGPDPAPPIDSSSVTGRVADAQTGEGLAGVMVQVGTLKATSDSSGKYSLADVPVNANVVVQFSKPEYAVNFATVDVVKGQASVADRRLAKVATRKELSVAAGGVVALDNSPAQVALPAGGLVNAATGAAASGTVAVEMTPIDPGIDPLNMPGNFRAQGEAAPIESMGALQVEIRDAAGALLNLAPGKVATIRIPVPAGARSPPLTMPLYYFKESTGLWVREGSATLAGASPQQYYEGQVSHFTVWNADRPTETIFINGCVVDQGRQPVAATVTSAGINYYGTASVQTTMPGGFFKVPARRDSRVLVTAQSGADSVSIDATTGSTDLTLPACLVMAQSPPVIFTQPADLTLAPGAIDALDVLATAGSQYQWYRNGQPVASTARYLVITGDGSAAADYSVVVKNAVGTVTSRTAKVTVGIPVSAPAIVAQPLNTSVVVGGEASFSIQAQGDSLSYQWLRNGVDIDGATGPTLTLGPASLLDSGALFKCRVSNSAGSIVSDAGLLTVTSEIVPAGIAQHPANASVTVGQRATFAVVASGTGPFTYQWLVNGAPIPNATAAAYQTTTTVLADTGAQYSVKVSNPKASVTSNQAGLTVSALSDVSGLHLFFVHGQVTARSPALGAVPAAGGSAVSLVPAGQGELLTMFPQGTASNGSYNNIHWRNLLLWQNQRLYRQDLVASAGLAAPVAVSTLDAAALCEGGPAAASDSSIADVGIDLVDSLKSWNIFRKLGPDAKCGTQDDSFVAVRMNMAASVAPLSVARPVSTMHAPDGALTGWLLRQGQQMQRVNADFSNPVDDFTLPAADLTFDNSTEISSNILIFSSGGKVYAADLDTPAPTIPVLVTGLSDRESLAHTLQIDAQTVLIAIGGTNTTRLLRYTGSSKTSMVLGTLPAGPDSLLATPSRIVTSDRVDKVLALPLAGGQAQTIFTSGAGRLGLQTFHGGERIWLQAGDAVVSVNSDGNGIQTLAGAQLVGCVLPPAGTLWNWGCDAVVVVQGNSARAYDAATGALRVTYGDVSLPSAPITSIFSSINLTTWGQGAVLTQVQVSGSSATAVNYYIKSDQPGITQLALP